ncbi:MAG TPA: DNA/RNA non-specific endonuclease [Pseudolabrys sp.]|nr:DNA/RNA non-specific endonuclease [Pseudolabrys sp.]
MSKRHNALALKTRHLPISMLFVGALALLLGTPARAEVSAADAKSGIVECTPDVLKDHNPGLADNPDRVICFQGYISNFNTKPRTGKPKFLGVPHWVVHHVKRAPKSPESGERPNSWFTVFDLADKGIAPIDDSYSFSKKFRTAHKNWYDRGHQAQKYLVERLGNKAALFTHNVVNALPQLHNFNAGPWLTLECFTGAWANKFGEVWVVAGPVFKKNKAITWLRSDINKKAVPVAIPDANFKIVARKDGDQWDLLAFVYPQSHKSYAKGPFDPEIFFKSVADIEQMTGEKFLSGLPGAEQLKQKTADKLWPVAKSDFDTGCNKQAAEVK